ncbi:putative secreted RxLR effector protein [Phytophthora cinnamomi]|uniref:putative secreted RxLR effector protein n=1 Tax=Phytophthora cinnamomi TaxID=4785 RepID=UPI00355A6C85|nr:putative secreted RxLR effector protein [Phytophthora cinnamomi]
MLGSGLKVAVLAAAVACYVRPQLLLQPLLGSELDGADADASVRVLRGLLTLLSYALASIRPSWFWVLAALAALQLALWGLQLAEDSLLGMSVEAEKKLFLAGTMLCFAAIVSVILFGGKGDAKARFRKRLVAFYTKHNPEKLREVDELLRKYEFNEELLFQRLHRKYNALAAGPENHSVMKKIDESEFLYEEEEEERVESSEEEDTTLVKETVAGVIEENNEAEKEEDEPARAFTPQQSSGSTGSDESFELVEKKTVAVAVVSPLEIEDYDLLEGTPPVSPRSAEKSAYTHRQSSTLIKDAIALSRQAQRERVERRIANIASKRGDGYAGH